MIELRFLSPSPERGFTLIELISAIAIVGLLAAIAAPSWLSYTRRARLSRSQSQIYRAMMAAKSNAIRDKMTWQASFREKGDRVQWVVHPADKNNNFIPPLIWNNEGLWQNLERGVKIDSELNDRGKKETTFHQDSIEQLWRVQFNDRGCSVYKPGSECNLNGQGTLTLKNSNGGILRRCVIISTILGLIRRGNNHTKPNGNDKYCY